MQLGSMQDTHKIQHAHGVCALVSSSKHRFSSFGHALKIRYVDKQGMDLGMRPTLTNKEQFHL